VRQAIVRIASKSLVSSGDDVQSEIDKLIAAKLLPSDFQLSGGQKSLNANCEEDSLKKFAAQLVNNIICKVKQQLDCEQDPFEAEQSEIDVDELVNAVELNGGCSLAQRPRRSKSDNECGNARQQVLQCSLQLLDQQTEAIVRDVQRVRQQVADRMVSEVTCGEGTSEIRTPSGTSSSAKISRPDSRTSTAGRPSRSPSRGSTTLQRQSAAKRESEARRQPEANKNESRSLSMLSARTSGSKRVSASKESNKKGKQRNSRRSSDKNKSWNANVVESSELDSDDDEESEETEDEESGSSDDSEEESSEDEQQRNNSARTKQSSLCRLPLNSNCNAATGSEYDCGGCGGCSGCRNSCGNRVASCSVQDVLDRETLCRALEACDNGKMPVSDAELRKFALDVVESLYAAVRAKLSSMLDDEYKEAGGKDSFPKDELLTKADEEVRSEVLPVVVDHIVWLMKEERRSLGQLDCDMMMIAFAGQFVDTIVTNAVIKTQVDLSSKRAYTRTFVATSNGGSKSRSSIGPGSGSGTGVKPTGSGGNESTNNKPTVSGANENGGGSGTRVRSILRMSSQKFADNEQVEDVWTRESQLSAKKSADEDQNVSNNCNKLDLARSFASTSLTAREDRSQKSQRPYRRQTNSKLKNNNAANHFYSSSDRDTNSNNNNGNDGHRNCDVSEGGYRNTCNDCFIPKKNASSSAACVFHSVYRLSKNVFCYYTYDDCKHDSWNNNNYNYDSNYNTNNNCADTFSDDADHAGDVIGTTADDAGSHHAENVQTCEDDIGDCKSERGGAGNEHDGTTQQRSSGDDDEAIAAKISAKSEQSSSLAPFYDDCTEVASEGLHPLLSTTVSHLLSVLGSPYLCHRALDCAAEWLSRYRESIESPRFCDRQRRRWRRDRLQQACIRAGRALLDQVPLSSECLSTVDRSARQLFRRAVDGTISTVYDIEHHPTHDLDVAQVSLTDRTRSLWHQAIHTSELLLLKTAIRANFCDFHTPASLLFYWVICCRCRQH